jgi:hypothetical protein
VISSSEAKIENRRAVMRKSAQRDKDKRIAGDGEAERGQQLFVLEKLVFAPAAIRFID